MYHLSQLFDYLHPSPICGRKMHRPPISSSPSLSFPIHVWSYWDGEVSPTVQACHASWRRHLPEDRFIIHLLTPSTVSDFVHQDHSCFASEMKALRSDYIRLSLLHRHGGVWLDASVLLLKGLDEWEFLGSEGADRCFSAIFNARNMSTTCDYPVVETSVMASPPGHKLVEDWMNRMYRVEGSCREGDVDAYMNAADDRALQRKNLWKRYHAVYHMLQHTFFYFGGLSKYDGASLYNAQHYGLAYDVLARARQSKAPFVKFIASERESLDSLLRAGSLPKDSILSQYL